MDMRRISLIGLVAVSVLCLGCSSKSGSNRLLSKSASGVGQSSATAPLGDARYEDLVREMEENGGQAAFRRATPKSTTQKISGAIKKATATVGSALTIKPKVRQGARSAGPGQHAQEDRHRLVLSGRSTGRIQRQCRPPRSSNTNADWRKTRTTCRR